MTTTIGSDVAILALVIPFLVLVAISGFRRTIEVCRQRWWQASVTRWPACSVPVLGSGTSGYYLLVRVDGMPHCFPEILETKADLAVCIRFQNNSDARPLHSPATFDGMVSLLAPHGDYSFWGTPPSLVRRR